MTPEKYQIRFAQIEDRAAIMGFIENHWRKGHLLAKDVEFFNYQYQTQPDRLNMVIAIHEEFGVESLLGFIPANQEVDSIWLALWKTVKAAHAPNLGMACLEYLLDEIKPKIIACNGISVKTKVIYQFLGYELAQLQQYYLPNPNCQEPVLASFGSKARPTAQGQAVLSQVDSLDKLKALCSSDLLAANHPHKDLWYLENRFLKHPSFDYQIYAIEDEGKCRGILVLRKLLAKGASALRVMDFIGDTQVLAEIGSCLSQLLIEEECEYVDFFQLGVPQGILEQAGFTLNDQEDGVVIPDYFQPFTHSNVELHCFTNQLDEFLMFKADGDQDRPN